MSYIVTYCMTLDRKGLIERKNEGKLWCKNYNHLCEVKCIY